MIYIKPVVPLDATKRTEHVPRVRVYREFRSFSSFYRSVLVSTFILRVLLSTPGLKIPTKNIERNFFDGSPFEYNSFLKRLSIIV